MDNMILFFLLLVGFVYVIISCSFVLFSRGFVVILRYLGVVGNGLDVIWIEIINW